MSLNTDYAVVQENKGILEELFIHEAAHASLDGAHSNVCSQMNSDCSNNLRNSYNDFIPFSNCNNVTIHFSLMGGEPLDHQMQTATFQHTLKETQIVRMSLKVF